MTIEELLALDNASLLATPPTTLVDVLMLDALSDQIPDELASQREKLLAEVLESPEMQAAYVDMVNGISIGILEARLDALTAALIDAHISDGFQRRITIQSAAALRNLIKVGRNSAHETVSKETDTVSQEG